MSKETLHNELLHAVRLDSKQRGELAELAFMRKAAALGFAVAKPWGDSDRYDVILRVGRAFWRVQVKSVWAQTPARNHYRIKTSSGGLRAYSAEEIDFLVAYIFPKDVWYVFPVAVVEHRGYLWVSPENEGSKYHEYREAWNLMGPTVAEPDAAAAGT